MNTFEESLQLNPGAKPKFPRGRAVLFAMKEAIEVELDRLESAGVVEKGHPQQVSSTCCIHTQGEWNA